MALSFAATEYRNWLFYYCLPCMRGILNEEYHQHYALLVGAIVTLSGRTISPAQLEKARKCLVHFVEMIDVYYGMNSNIAFCIGNNVFACVLL
jgi:hypothetical protein